ASSDKTGHHKAPMRLGGSTSRRSSRAPSSSTAAGAKEITGKGITNETGRDFRSHSGDAGVLIDDGGVWTCERTGVYTSSESVSSSSDSVISDYVFAISSQVPWYLFREGRIGDDIGDDVDKGAS
nr:hypothetical protein [Tanacetum cinerariifolium]